MGVLESIVRETAENALVNIGKKGSQWVSIETTENENHITDIITFKARKIGARALKTYETIVEITDNESILVKGLKGETKFLKSDIKSFSSKKTSLITKIDIFRFALVPLLCFLPEISIIAALAAAAFFYYYTLINTVKIDLIDGTAVKVYYMTSSDAQILISKLQVSEETER